MGEKNQISFVDLTILQFLWICQTVYENIVSVFKWQFSFKRAPALENTKTFHEKRHFIQLYTTEPKKLGDKPICYMNVIEFDGSQEEEIRKRKNSGGARSNKTFLKYNRPAVRSHSENDLQKFYCSSLRF